MLPFVWRKSESCKWHPIPIALFDISGPILRLSRMNRPGLRRAYGRLQNYTQLRRAFRRKSCANTPKEILGKSEIGNFLRKTDKFLRKQVTHGAGRSCVSRHCRRILWAPTVTGRNVTGRICHLSFYTKQVSSPCHVSATHSMCSKNPPAVPRHTAPPGARVWPVCAKFACFAQKNCLFRFAKISFGLFAQKICGEMPSSISHRSCGRPYVCATQADSLLINGESARKCRIGLLGSGAFTTLRLTSDKG